MQRSGGADCHPLAGRLTHDVPDHDALQPKACNSSEQPHKRGGEIEQTKLFGAQIAGDPDPYQKPHTHTQHFVKKKPADVVDDLQQVGPMGNAAP